VITAIDSNVIIDVLGADPTFGPRSRAAVHRSRTEGALVACDVVWAEVLAAFPNEGETISVLERLSVAYSEVGRDAAVSAGKAWRAYRQAGGPRERLVADFLVGAHAAHHADRLLTRDRGFQRLAFADLEVLDPSV
jgi:predicted nucleic acid-binding protein